MSEHGRDGRVQRTERLLHEALAKLIHEKPYDAIAVKEILARADVARSTFYAHFGDKDELLISAIEDILRRACSQALNGSAPAHERILRFSLPIFEHIASHRAEFPALAKSGDQRAVHARLRRVLEDFVTRELRRAPPRARPRMPVDLLARHVAGAFVLVLDWWVDEGGQLTAREVNEVFRSLVGPVWQE